MMFDMRRPATARMILRGAEARPDLLRFTAKGEALPAVLRSSPCAKPAIAARNKTRRVEKTDLVIAQDAAPGLSRRDLKRPMRSRCFASSAGAVTLGFDNRRRSAVMHVHGHAMRLLHDLDDGWSPIGATPSSPPRQGQARRLRRRQPRKWALHDDILEHEAQAWRPGSR